MNGLELAQQTIGIWRQNHGNESVYNQCQRIDGWYTEWTWMGAGASEPQAYSTATIARQAGRIVSTDLNDLTLPAGARAYWHYNDPGHVCALVGHDGHRVLVSNSAHGGDTVMDLGNGWKISHADTIELSFAGWSLTDGQNPQITGVTWYGDETIAGNQRKTLSTGTARQRPEPNTAAETVQEIPANTVGTFDGWIHGENIGGNDVWFHGALSGLWSWSGGFTDTGTHDLADMNVAIQPNQRQALASDAANQRTEPKSSAPVQGTIAANAVGTFDGWITGEDVGGNAVWFRGALSGLWSWSGGFTDTGTHDLADLNGTDPDPGPVLDPGYKDRPVDSTLATWVGSPNYNWRDPRAAGEAPNHVTMHWMDGTLAGTDAQFQKYTTINDKGTADGSSSNYGIGQTEIHQYVQEKDYQQADGDTYSNRWGLSIEHEGSPTSPVTQAVMDASARLLADIATRYGWTGFEVYEDHAGFVNLTDDEQAKIVEDHAAAHTTRLVFPHKAWVSTDCPGTLDYPAIVDAANTLLDPGPDPDPDPGPLDPDDYPTLAALHEELTRAFAPAPEKQSFLSRLFHP